MPRLPDERRAPQDDGSRPLAFAVDATFQFIGVLTPAGVLLDANRSALDFVGASLDEVVGRPFWDTLWWSDAPQQQRWLREAVRKVAAGAFVRSEVEHHAPDGRTMAVDFSLKPIRGEAGEVRALLAEGRDITDRKRVEAALSASEVRFAGIVAAAADAILVVDDSSRITLFNVEAEKVFGYRADEVLGRDLAILLPEHARAAHAAHMRAFASSGTAARRMEERSEILGRRKNGEIFPAEATISQLRAGDEHLFTAVLRDVSDRRRAEAERQMLLAQTIEARAAAEASERRATFLADAGALLGASLDYEATFASLTRLIVPALAVFCIIDVLEEDGTVRRLQVAHARPWMQEATDRLRRYPRPGQTRYLTRLALQSGRAHLYRAMDDAMMREVCDGVEHLATFRALAPTSCVVVPLVAREQVLGAIALCRDASAPPYDETDLYTAMELASRAALAVDHARLYHRARTAVRGRDEMLGVVSHDLRNPLSAISMCASTLLDMENGDGGRRADLLRTVQESADWAHRLIQDLLDVTSIEAGRLSVDRRPVDAVLLLAQAVELFEPVANERDLTLLLDVPEHLPKVEVDADRILQALGNLLGNAFKFTPAGGRVRIEAWKVDEGVRVAVTDSGPGIPDEDVPFIFDRFWHARRPGGSGGAVRGTGLGLAIVKGIVEAHGGLVWVERGSEGGSRFVFSLPGIAAREEARKPEPTWERAGQRA